MKLLSPIRRIIRRYVEIHGSLLTKGLSFSLIVGTVPLLFTLFLAGSILVTPEIVTLLEGELLNFLPEGIRRGFLAGIERYSRNPGSLSLFTVAFFLLAVNNLFFDLYRTLAVGIGCRWSPKRGRIAAVAAGALLLALLYVAALASAAAELIGRIYPLPTRLITFGSRSFSALVATGAFFAIFRAAAGRPLKRGRTIAISLGAAIVWRVLFTAGGATVRVAGSRFVAYGVMAWAVVFLTFMRLMAEILLFSAILIREFAVSDDT